LPFYHASRWFTDKASFAGCSSQEAAAHEGERNWFLPIPVLFASGHKREVKFNVLNSQNGVEGRGCVNVINHLQFTINNYNRVPAIERNSLKKLHVTFSAGG
jgi:hypothetical protein